MSNLYSYSSSYGRLELHIRFKVKYCHPVFRIEIIANRCREIFYEVVKKHGIVIEEIGFDKDHVHIIAKLNPSISVSQVAKLLKGTSGYKLLKEFPYMKRKYFWGSGLRSPTVYFDSIGQDPEKNIKLRQKPNSRINEYHQSLTWWIFDSGAIQNDVRLLEVLQKR